MDIAVDGTQDGTYAPGDNSNDPGGNQVPGLEQHKDGDTYIHIPLYCWCQGNNRSSIMSDV